MIDGTGILKNSLFKKSKDLKTIDDINNKTQVTQIVTSEVSAGLHDSAEKFRNKIGRKSDDVFGDDVNFAYENKYSIVVESPFKQTGQNNYFLIDSIHMVSSSIPSLSVDILENKVNNYRRKSAGNIIGDSFSIQFRDNAKREYYLFFQQWLQQLYSTRTPSWDRKIKLYNYPDDYIGKIRFFMLKSNTDGMSKISNEMNFEEEEVYPEESNEMNFTVQEATDFKSSEVKPNDTTKTIPLGYELYSSTDTILTETNNYILYVIEFSHIFPSQVGDVILGSTSGELSTFDVTFEYSLPITYYEWDSAKQIFTPIHTI